METTNKTTASGTNWTLYNCDCVDLASSMPENSIDFSVYSPPFANLYIYSDSAADMGNCRDDAQFFEQYRYLIRELYRATVPGRLTAIHCKDLPAYFGRDGYSGLKDFPGEIIRAHEAEGWNFHSRVTIWKCPVTERERTNNNGLLHKTIKRDRSQVRQGMADYLIVMRKIGSEGLMSDKPIASDGLDRYIGTGEADPRIENSFHPSPYSRNKVASDDSINIWRRYAEPVWWDIDQTDVLNFQIARDSQDEKHICPLQLGVIRRAVQLWSAPGDVVFSPFTGIGSEGVIAVEMGRKFIGSELKESYFKHAAGFIEAAEFNSQDLFTPVNA